LCAAVASPTTQVYNIGSGGLVNTPNNCGGGSLYNDCGATAPGFSWSDSGSGTVTGLTVQVGIGVDCNGSGVSHTVTLNGNNVGTFTPAGNWCSCGFINNVVTLNLSTTGYNVGGTNTLNISSGNTCFGFINGTSLGANYAVVTVTKNSASCGSSGGNTFSWSPSTFLNNPAIQSPVASGITSNTTYTVTATSGAGCTGTGSVAITAGASLGVTIAATPPVVSSGASGYAFGTSTGNTLETLNSPTTIVGTALDDTPSGIQNIGFNFTFDGTTYTQFSASSNGLMRLGGSQVTGAFSNSTAGATLPGLMPWWDDLYISTINGVCY
jgi:hypothetical protein